MDWDKVFALISPHIVFPEEWDEHTKKEACKGKYHFVKRKEIEEAEMQSEDGEQEEQGRAGVGVRDEDEEEDEVEMQDCEDGDERGRIRKQWTPEEEAVLMKAASRPSSKRKNGTMDWDKVFALISPHIVFPEEWDEHTKKEACKGKYHFVKRKEIEEAEMQSEDGEQEEQGRAGVGVWEWRFKSVLPPHIRDAVIKAAERHRKPSGHHDWLEVAQSVPVKFPDSWDMQERSLWCKSRFFGYKIQQARLANGNGEQGPRDANGKARKRGHSSPERDSARKRQRMEEEGPSTKGRDGGKREGRQGTQVASEETPAGASEHPEDTKAGTILQFLVLRDSNPEPFYVNLLGKMHAGHFKQDAQRKWVIVDRESGDVFPSPMKWAIGIETRVTGKQRAGISVKPHVFYKGMSLRQHETRLFERRQ